MERCEFCFRVHMLPLQAGGWGCFIGVSSVGKGRGGSGQSSPPSKWSGAAQNSKCQCSEQPFCTRPPAAILDCSAVSRLHTASSRHLGLQCREQTVHGLQPPSWIAVLWLASLHTAPSRHLGLEFREQTLYTAPSLHLGVWNHLAEVLAKPFYRRNSGLKNWVQGLCTWPPVRTWNQTKHKGEKKG